MEYGFGVDLGGTAVKIGFYHTSGKLLDKWEIPTDTSENGANILKDIADSIEGYMANNKIPRSNIMGIGIGVPGPVDGKGNVNRCVNLGWGVFNIQQELEAITGFPVKAGNDANVAALGECWQGAAKGFQNVVMLTLGTGVGGAVILGGKILPGSHGAAGEIGHMALNPEEKELCSCGKAGCAEQYCSATGVVNVAKRYLKMSFDPSSLREKEPLTCKDVFDAAEAGDKAAQDILEQVYRCLAMLTGNVCNVVNPEMVVIGGGVSKAGNVLLEGIRKYFHLYAFHAVQDVKFAIATLGNDAGTCGAFRLIQQAGQN